MQRAMSRDVRASNPRIVSGGATLRSRSPSAPVLVASSDQDDRLVRRTAKISVAAQIVIGLASGAGIFASKDAELTRILVLETTSQFVELAWYVVTLLRAKRVRAWTRYLDWTISTPTMLLSTVLFFRLRGGSGPLRDDGIVLMFGFNWLMLSFGLSAEAGTLPKHVALILGTAAFVAVFAILATFLPPPGGDDGVCTTLFCIMYVVWGLYGCAAVFDETHRNVAYNALDVVSKNFYGLFLAVYALRS